MTQDQATTTTATTVVPEAPAQATDPMKDPAYLSYVAKQQKDKLVADYSTDPLRKPLLEEGGLRVVLDANPNIMLDSTRLATAIEFAQANVIANVKKTQAENKTQNAAPAATTPQPPAGDTATQPKPLAKASYKELLEAAGGDKARAADGLAYFREEVRLGQNGRIELS